MDMALPSQRKQCQHSPLCLLGSGCQAPSGSPSTEIPAKTAGISQVGNGRVAQSCEFGEGCVGEFGGGSATHSTNTAIDSTRRLA